MTQQNQEKPDDEIDLIELAKVLWAGKFIIILTTAIFGVASVFYALSLPNIYKSEALLAPVSEASGLKVPGQLGGLAALAGVNLNSGSGDKTDLALAILKSRDFIGRFIEKHDLLIPLMAAKNWNIAENRLIIDSDIYDEQKKEWKRQAKPPLSAKPSLLEAYETFTKSFSTSQDKSSGMVKLTIHHISPYLAQEWVTLLVKEINEEVRQRELGEAQNSLNYLNEQIAQTNIADIRTMLFSLIEEQTKTVMLANVREEYVFKTIDPAVVAEKKSKPARALICLLSISLGGILSSLIILLRHFARK